MVDMVLEVLSLIMACMLLYGMFLCEVKVYILLWRVVVIGAISIYTAKLGAYHLQ